MTGEQIEHVIRPSCRDSSSAEIPCFRERQATV